MCVILTCSEECGECGQKGGALALEVYEVDTQAFDLAPKGGVLLKLRVKLRLVKHVCRYFFAAILIVQHLIEH